MPSACRRSVFGFLGAIQQFHSSQMPSPIIQGSSTQMCKIWAAELKVKRGDSPWFPSCYSLSAMGGDALARPGHDQNAKMHKNAKKCAQKVQKWAKMREEMRDLVAVWKRTPKTFSVSDTRNQKKTSFKKSFLIKLLHWKKSVLQKMCKIVEKCKHAIHIKCVTTLRRCVLHQKMLYLPAALRTAQNSFSLVNV